MTNDIKTNLTSDIDFAITAFKKGNSANLNLRKFRMPFETFFLLTSAAVSQFNKLKDRDQKLNQSRSPDGLRRNSTPKTKREL